MSSWLDSIWGIKPDKTGKRATATTTPASKVEESWDVLMPGISDIKVISNVVDGFKLYILF
jgi:hypothetical protein